MNCLSRLSRAARATALLLAAAFAVLTVDSTGAIAWNQSHAVHRQVVAQAITPDRHAIAQVGA